jgi:hypothetical protein
MPKFLHVSTQQKRANLEAFDVCLIEQLGDQFLVRPTPSPLFIYNRQLYLHLIYFDDVSESIIQLCSGFEARRARMNLNESDKSKSESRTRRSTCLRLGNSTHFFFFPRDLLRAPTMYKGRGVSPGGGSLIRELAVESKNPNPGR